MGPIFLFFLLFFPTVFFFAFFLLFNFQNFSFFVNFFIFSIFFDVFHFLFAFGDRNASSYKHVVVCCCCVLLLCVVAVRCCRALLSCVVILLLLSCVVVSCVVVSCVVVSCCWLLVVSYWLLVVWDTVERVCMYTPHNAHVQAKANSSHTDLETWACAPQKSTYSGPGMNRTVLQIMLIATPPLAINTKIPVSPEQCNLFQTRGRACIDSPTRCAGFYLFGRILFLPGPEPLTQ